MADVSIATDKAITKSPYPISSQINKFIYDLNVSSLQVLFFDVYGINATCLSLIVILIIQIIFKFNFNNMLKLISLVF